MPRIHRVLRGCVSAETAYVQADYPYGKRLRCQRRCWLEYKTRYGFRFVSQTNNPRKTGLHWNRPKRSKYSRLAVLVLTDKYTNAAGEPVDVSHFSPSSNQSLDALDAFVAAFGLDFDDNQRQVAEGLGRRLHQHGGSRTGRRFIVSDATSGEQLTPEPVTAGDPIFAACVPVRVDRRYGPPLEQIDEKIQSGVFDSYRIGRVIRVQYVDTTPDTRS